MKAIRTMISRGKLTVLTVMVALVLSAAPAAVAANGNPWILGKANSVTRAITTLGGPSGVNGPMLRIANNNAGADATALNLQVESGHAPMKVNSNTRVDNLNADHLDGKDSGAFLEAGAKATDAELLDGTDSSGFVRGNGEVISSAVALGPAIGISDLVFPRLPSSPPSPKVAVYYSCPANLSSDGTLIIKNEGTETVNVFSDNGGVSPNAYKQLVSQDFISQPAAAGGEHITFQVQGMSISTIEVFSVHRTSALGTGTDNKCHVQAQGLYAQQ